MLGEQQQPMAEIPPPKRKQQPRRHQTRQVTALMADSDLADYQYTMPAYEDYEDDSQKATSLADEFDVESYDAYLTAQVSLPLGDHYTLGNVKHCKRDKDGN